MRSVKALSSMTFSANWALSPWIMASLSSIERAAAASAAIRSACGSEIAAYMLMILSRVRIETKKSGSLKRLPNEDPGFSLILAEEDCFTSHGCGQILCIERGTQKMTIRSTLLVYIEKKSLII